MPPLERNSYHYPSDRSPWVVVPYGDGWAVYHTDDGLLVLTEEHDVIVMGSAEAAEALILMMMRPPSVLASSLVH